jgi:DNA-binding GntR family transcriptional regulator
MPESLQSPVEVQSLVDVVTERIEAAIIDGRLEPGSRISEQKLATSMGVSRGPLREAIRRLEGRKLVTRIPNVGVRVAELSTQDLLELLQIRESLESLACGLAATKMSDEEIDDLAALIASHQSQPRLQDGSGYYQDSGDHDFHFRIVKASGNQRLIQMLCEELYDLLRVYRYRSSTSAGRANEALAEHKAIIDALRSRDPAKAQACMAQHLRKARSNVEQQLMSRTTSKDRFSA